jgi:hypothetical protein
MFKTIYQSPYLPPNCRSLPTHEREEKRFLIFLQFYTKQSA